MQQVIIIHGGDSFSSLKKFHRALKSQPVSLKTWLPRKGWKAGMPKALGPQYQVLLPSMPNKDNARYVEWKIWFERMQPYIRNDVILIGHSLGGIFLAKYLSEKKLPRKIKALILVAAPHHLTREIGDFGLKKSLRNLSQCRQIILCCSQDDPVVPWTELASYQQALPQARTYAFRNKAHFNQPTFPELVKIIKEL